MSGLLAVSLLGQTCVVQQAYSAPIQYAQSYGQTYANQAYVEKTVFVAVEDPQSYYAGLVGSQQRQAERQAQAQQVQSTTDAKIDRLAAIVEALQKRLETQPNEPQTLLPPKPQAVPSPSNQPAYGSEGVPPPPTVSQASARKSDHVGLATLAKACGACHTGTATAGAGVVLFAVDGSFRGNERDTLERIEAEITSGRMPKPTAKRREPITLKEYVAIRDFLNEQAGPVAMNSTPRKRTQ